METTESVTIVSVFCIVWACPILRRQLTRDLSACTYYSLVKLSFLVSRGVITHKCCHSCCSARLKSSAVSLVNHLWQLSNVLKKLDLVDITRLFPTCYRLFLLDNNHAFLLLTFDWHGGAHMDDCGLWWLLLVKSAAIALTELHYQINYILKPFYTY